ncbi:epithelial membrane 1 [Pelobates cultripes]|uniref:Epithelial membrane protein 1 n=1 Tax=Pelobates cultripes TaxID=61616 RepID=A0AAD1SUQ8_PELCU|nr:epithelial membrane 1 [Pelobates cultripes]
MLFVSTISNVLMQSTEGVWLQNSNGSLGIWLACGSDSCQSIFTTLAQGDEAAMKAVEAFMVLAIIFSCFALCAFIAQLFMLDKGQRFYVTGGLMLVCWLCVLIGVSIYTARFSRVNTFYHGYCFILAWICFCFSLLVGILYLVLRKK